MGLIQCPVCKNLVSEQAPTCPTCGQPIARLERRVSSTGWVTFNGLTSAFIAVILFVVIGGLIAAAATRPSESELRNALLNTYGPIYGAGVVAEKLGVIKFNYNNYLVYSTLSANLVTQPDQVVAYGYFGKSHAPNPTFDLGWSNREDHVPSEQPVSEPTNTAFNKPVSEELHAAKAIGLPPPSVLSPEEIHGNLRDLFPLIKTEMYNEAIKAARRKHPASDFVGNGCEESSFETKSYVEVRWTYHGTYRCQMRGAILGITRRNFSINVEAQVEIRNGVFESKILGSRYYVDG
ncbi:MAG: zinc ribbon domain-containing protein [Pyrinomonadaceae bacterium]